MSVLGWALAGGAIGLGIELLCLVPEVIRRARKRPR